MRLAAGTRVGPYEILSVLGAGGMGEVYRARDPHLHRDIALKILPEHFAEELDRVARFKREAQVLASLNHPHIAAIYGFEEASGLQALALELVEGPTLADRIAHGPVPLDEALPIAQQIAEALEAAHERGIIHRDLKPANVKLRPDGTVKVLDFGLAKAADPVSSSVGGPTMSPTITSPAMTQMGLILGTAAYMSPEQAKGHPADKRSDVWSFGAVLYEMLCGRRTFQGDDIVDTLAAVRRQDIDWTVLPATTPPSVRYLLARCLERDVKQRLRDIGEARIVLGHSSDPHPHAVPAPPVTPPRSLARRTWPMAVVSLVIGAIGAFAAWQLKPAAAFPVSRFSFTLPEGQPMTMGGFGRTLAMSPDGTQVVYVSTPGPQLYLRSMSQLEGKAIPGTDVFEGVSEPAFSPDGRSIAFFARADQSVKRIATTGRAATTLCALQGSYETAGLSWSADGIVFGLGRQGVMRVSPDGGPPQQIVRVKDGEAVYGPMLLPGGQHVLFTLATGTARDRWDKAHVMVQSVASGERKTLIDDGSDARYVPTGHLVYALSGIVYAVAFDLKRLETYGPRIPVIEGVRRSSSGLTGAAAYSISSTGSLSYMPGPVSATSSEFVRADRKGGVERLKLPAGSYSTPRASPDGKRIAFTTEDGVKGDIIYTYDLEGGLLRRLTYDGSNRFPVWSSDGFRVAFQSDRGGDLGIWWQATAGGKAERLTKAEPNTAHAPESWSPKGDTLLYSVTKGSEVSLRAYSPTTKKDVPYGRVRSSNPPDAMFSPDGRWVVYGSNEGGRSTIYVEPFPDTGDKFQLVAKGSDTPHEAVWSPDGAELLYNAAPGGRFESVKVTTTPAFAFGTPALVTKRFSNSPPWQRRRYDITRDGQFIGLLPVGQADASPGVMQIVFVLNWYEELKRLVPTR